MVNERKTENIVRENFRNSGCIIEEQKSDNSRINKLLFNASKKGSGCGKPEFICSNILDVNDLLIVIECKADILKHESPNHDRYDEYAVDGVLLYSSYLSKEYDVLSIAVSGETTENLKISHYLQLRDSNHVKKVFGEKLLPIEDYVKGYKNSPEKCNQDYNNLKKYFKELNNKLFNYKIPEDKRLLLVESIIISLEREEFRTSYRLYTKSNELSEFLVNTTEKRLKEKYKTIYLETIMSNFNFIKTHSILNSENNILKELINEIDIKINKYMKSYLYYDILGELHIEFLRYANSDASLGIVLTPPHITELFQDLARVNKDSKILDNCTGTGGFLISGTRRMIEYARGDEEKIQKIKNEQLIGIEFMSHIFTLAACNTIIHDYLNPNLFLANCFEKDIIEKIKKYQANVGMLNPPYDGHEIEFILNNLSMIKQNSLCIAIIPMRCALLSMGREKELKESILKNHTLEAVLSMPDQLFSDSMVGVVTCVMIIRAHQPHPKDYKTFFGYFKNDGFYVKKKVRADYDNKWNNIKSKWINLYNNREEISGLSVKKCITTEDEWCAEAYMETDYSKITKEDLIENIRKFLVFSEMNLK